jgi:DNA polymerase III sliding clamp (beta) subunit (PCNA family)
MSDRSDNENKIDAILRADTLSSVVKPPVEIAEDGVTNFHWGEDALRIRTVNPANAIVVSQKISPSEFYHYDVAAEKDEVIFGTRCKTISNLLKAAASDDHVRMTLENSGTEMNISFSDVDYDLSGVDPDSVSEPDLPDLDYDTNVTVHSRVFMRAYQVIGMMTEAIWFEVNQNDFRVWGRGDADSAEIQVSVENDADSLSDDKEGCIAILNDVRSAIEAKYGTRYINLVNRFTPSTFLELRMAEDYPMKIISNGEGRYTEIVIAPRMDSE